MRLPGILGQEWRTTAGVAVVVGYVTALLWLSTVVSYDVWTALILAPILLLVGAFCLRASAQRLGDPWLFRVAAAALVAKLAASMVRFLTAEYVYGTGDSMEYHRVGRHLALSYRDLVLAAPEERRTLVGTGFLMALTAALYALIGPTLIGAYLLFAFAGFWGTYLCYLALRRAVPWAQHRRYAWLVLFLPTLLYWPSALGKDAWMQLWIGVALYGAALALTHATKGLLVLALGLAGTALIRPHISGLLFASFVAAVLLRPPRRRTQLTPVLKVGSLAVLAVVGAALLQRVAQFAGAESLTPEALLAAITETGGNTAQGGSEFTPVPLTSPFGVPMAFLTVLFRPLPFDAHNAQALIAAVEGTFLLGLTWRYRRSLMTGLRRARSHPWIVMCLAYTLLFVVTFSSFANFGILTRQRAQVYPAVLVLLCLAHRGGRRHPEAVPLAAATTRPTTGATT